MDRASQARMGSIGSSVGESAGIGVDVEIRLMDKIGSAADQTAGMLTFRPWLRHTLGKYGGIRWKE